MKMKRGKIFTKKLIWIALGLAVIIGGYLYWQHKKYPIVEQKLKSTVFEKSEGLYRIHYDSLHFDELAGNVRFENVSLLPDTNRFLMLPIDKRPLVLIQMKARAIVVTGVKTLEAIGGKNLEGDSVRIDDPEVVIYNLKPFVKDTKIESEAKEIYQEILGQMDLIRVKNVIVKNLNLTTIDFITKNKNLTITKGQLKIKDILIDSAHNDDSARVLFSKQFDFAVDTLATYNNNRRAFVAEGIVFDGQKKSLTARSIHQYIFSDDSSAGKPLVIAHFLKLNGLHADQIVKHKNLAIDSVMCDDITYYQFNQPKKDKPDNSKDLDSSGFAKVYSVDIGHIFLNNIRVKDGGQSKFALGKVYFHSNQIQAGTVKALVSNPFNFSKEIKLGADQVTFYSKDKKYTYRFRSPEINSYTHNLNIRSFEIIPYKNERQFAAAEKFQRDRYQVTMNNIRLKGIKMNELLDEKILASELTVSNVDARIYRDLTKPLEQKSKVGNYPSQLIEKLQMPISIPKATIQNAYVQYREKQIKSDSVGTVTFQQSHFTIKNITNIPKEISRNSKLTISFSSKILGVAPITGKFSFQLNDADGNFDVSAHIAGFDATQLNKVSIPMALIEVKSGKINSADFNFHGNNTRASGNMVMKYEDLKVNVLKIDKESKDVKKRGLLSFFANLVVLNNNPQSGELREVHPEFERDIYKSFFNLVWKTFFSGLKKTVGIP